MGATVSVCAANSPDSQRAGFSSVTDCLVCPLAGKQPGPRFPRIGQLRHPGHDFRGRRDKRTRTRRQHDAPVRSSRRSSPRASGVSHIRKYPTRITVSQDHRRIFARDGPRESAPVTPRDRLHPLGKGVRDPCCPKRQTRPVRSGAIPIARGRRRRETPNRVNKLPASKEA